MRLGREEFGPNEPNDCLRTPVSCAAVNRNEEVVKILHEREGADPDRARNFPLRTVSKTASGKHDGVVKILYRRKEIKPHMRSKSSPTPLSFAARWT